jgi:uncharacterized DUF497 family protein
MRITYDPAKRIKTLATRKLDFDDAWRVLTGDCCTKPDTRRNYGEHRYLCFGMLNGRMVVVGYTPRNGAYHVFTMRKANAREKRQYAELLRN